MRTYVLTIAAGKRLIGMAVAAHPAVRGALESGTVVIVAGTTNGYVAEEVLAAAGIDGFSRRRFYRGITRPPGDASTDETPFPGDVVLVRGRRLEGKTIFDVVDDMAEGDVIIKGANALDLQRRQAAVLIGDTRGGTAAAAMQAVIGRRVRLIVPVGLEKRVSADLPALAARLASPGSVGPRLMPLVGEVITEIDAIGMLTGASAELVAAGGVAGAEGCAWLAIEGSPEQARLADEILAAVGSEPGFAA